jgi:hypothetical protein
MWILYETIILYDCQCDTIPADSSVNSGFCICSELTSRPGGNTKLQKMWTGEYLGVDVIFASVHLDLMKV